MKMSKLASALAFCLALSAGQAHADTASVLFENFTEDDITNIKFYPSDKGITKDTKNSGNVKAGQRSQLVFDRPKEVCVFNFQFNFKDSTGNAVIADVPTWDYCKSNGTINFVWSHDTSPRLTG